MRTTLPLAFSLIAACAAPALGGELLTGTCVEVVDGDTLHVATGEDQPLVVHLADIDAPELGQARGEEASALLSELALNKEVSVEVLATDEAGEVTAKVMVGEIRAAKAVLEAGLAWTLETKDEQLAVASIMGRGGQLGLWQDEDPVQPWLWREQQVMPTPKPRQRSLASKAREADPNVGGPSREDRHGPGAGAVAVPAPGTNTGGGPWVDFAVMCSVDQIEVCARNAFVRFYPKVNSGDEAGEVAKMAAGTIKSTDLLGLPIRGTSTAGKPYAGWATWPGDAAGSCRVTVRVPKV